MKFAHKILAAVLSVSCLFPLPAMAVSKADTVRQIVQATNKLGDEKYVQYDLTGYLSTLLGRGDYELKGESIQQPMLRTKAKGQVKLNTIGGTVVITPVELYVMEDSDHYVVYAKKGNSWVKSITKKDKTENLQKDKSWISDSIQTAHVLADEKNQQTILFTLNLEKKNAKAQEDILLKTTQQEGKVLTKDDEKKILGSMQEMNYLVTIDKEKGLPLSYEADCTPFAKALMNIVIGKMEEKTRMNEIQKGFIKSIGDSAQMKLAMHLTYNKGKDIVLPDEVRNAKEEKAEKEGVTEKKEKSKKTTKETVAPAK